MTPDLLTMLISLALCLAASSPVVVGAPWRNRRVMRLRGAAVRFADRWFFLCCAALMLLALCLRTYRLTALAASLSADEAFIAVNARFLFATGRDMSGSLLPPFLKNAGSTAYMGILTPLLTAPFISVLGMSSLAVRLPAVLLNLGALALMSALVCRACGRGGALLTLFAGAIAPWSYMAARFATPAHALLLTLLLGAYLWAKSCDLGRPAFAYSGAFAFALSMYTVDLAWLAAPLLMLGFVLYASVSRRFKASHGLGAFALFAVLSLPAFCVAAVNLLDLDAFQFLFMRIERFDAAPFLKRFFPLNGELNGVLSSMQQGFVACIGWLLLNVHADEFTPSGVWTLWNQDSAYAFSIPFLLVGGCSLGAWLRCRRRGAGVSLAFLMLPLALFLFFPAPDSQALYVASAVIVMVSCIGMRQVARKAPLSGLLVVALLVFTALPLAQSYFSDDYMDTTGDQYHPGLVDAVRHAQALSPDTLYMTKEIHPSVNPPLAAEAYARFAMDAPPGAEAGLEISYLPGLTPDPSARAAYVGRYDEFDAFDYEAYNFAEFGDYCVLTPISVYGER